MWTDTLTLLLGYALCHETLGLEALAFGPIPRAAVYGALVRQTGSELPPGLLQVRRLNAFGASAVDLTQ
jgi:hypothetical protein